MIKTKKLLILPLISLFLSGCFLMPQNNQNADQSEQNETTEVTAEDQEAIDEEQNPEQEEEKPQSNGITIDYDPTIVPDSDPLGNRIKDSYYSRRFSGNMKEAYEQVVNSVNNWETEISIPDLSIEELIRLMNVVIIDTPDAYFLGTSYSFSYNEQTGLINHITVNYALTKDEYNEIENAYLSTIRDYETMRDSTMTEIDALGRMVQTASSLINQEENEDYPGRANIPTLIVGKSRQKATSFEISRVLNCFAHHAGIDSIVVVGQEGVAKLSDLSKLDMLDLENRTVTLNIDDFSWFNEVCLNSFWYITDVYSQSIFNKTNNLNLGSTDLARSSAFFLLTTDERYARTHTWWISDTLLGETPCCDNFDFVAAYRNGDFIPMPANQKNPNNDYLTNYIKLFQERLIDNIISKKVSNAVLFFENKELYDIYKRTFKDTTKNYDSSGRKIEDYDIATLDEYYIITLDNFYSY